MFSTARYHQHLLSRDTASTPGPVSKSHNVTMHLDLYMIKIRSDAGKWFLYYHTVVAIYTEASDCIQ
jgi:hypothetical protein